MKESESDMTSPQARGAAETILSAALRHHRAGRLEQAETGYRSVLTTQPGHAGANHFLGLLAYQRGQHATAVDLIEKAIAEDGDNATYHQNLGCALKAMNRLDDAVASLQRAIALRPDYSEAHYNLGNALKELDRPDEASAAYRRAIEFNPRHAEALVNLGAALSATRDYDEAVTVLRRAVELAPDDADAYTNLGAALTSLARFEDSAAACARAVELRPDFAAAHCNLGNALQNLTRLDEAIAAYRRAVALAPDYAEAHQNLGISLLLAGHLREGWAEYEWRLKIAHLASLPPRFPQPLWDGSDVTGRTILLQAEQGLGDTLQFMRFAPMVAARCDRVVLQCPALLVRLLNGAPGIDEVVAYDGELPPFDTWASLVTVPRLFNVTFDTLTADVPYLAADPATAAAWRNRFGGSQGLRVGLVWAGNPRHGNDENRSLTLRQLEPLLRTPGASFFSLQIGEKAKELKELTDSPIEDLSPLITDFADTAAAIDCLDLVVSVDTSTAHMAGALGKPIWVLLPFVPDWRWMLERDDSPWYPTMRLYRQSKPGGWGPVIERVRRDLVSLGRSDG